MRPARLGFLMCVLATACNDGGEAIEASGDGSGGADSSTTDGATTDGPTADAATEGGNCGDVECAQNEVCDPATLECVCAEGTHDCDGTCVEDDAVEHCGDMCSPCPSSDNGVPACVDGTCELLCDDGHVPCDAGCCPLDTSVIAEVGRGASIAIDANNAPHVSFLASSSALTYAHLAPSGWQLETIGGIGTQPRPTAIAIDPNGEPVIAYRGAWAIHLTRRDGEAWSDEVLYESSSGYGPVVGPRGLAIDGAGIPHVVAEQRAESGAGSASDIWHLWWDGTQWARESIASSSDNRYSLPAIVIDGDDNVHVAWTSFFDDGLNYAIRGTDGWTHIVALDNASCCDDAIIALGPDDVPSVAYEARDLGYTIATGGAAWSFESVQDPVGRVGDIAYDGAGGLVYALTIDALHLGRPNGDGWDQSLVMPEAPSFMMALDGEDAAHFVVSGLDDVLQYAYEPAP